MKTKEDLINYFQEQIEISNQNAKECYLKQAKYLGLKGEYQEKTFLKSFLSGDNIFQICIDDINQLSDETIHNLIYEYELRHKPLEINKRTFFINMIRGLKAYEFTKKHIRSQNDLDNFSRDKKAKIKSFVSDVEDGFFNADTTINIPSTRSEIASVLINRLRSLYLKGQFVAIQKDIKVLDYPIENITPLRESIKILFERTYNTTKDDKLRVNRPKKLTKQELKEFEKECKRNTLDLSDPIY